MISRALRNAIFLQGLEVGRKPLPLRVGQQIGLFGPAPAPVNPFPRQGSGEEKKTPGTYGRNFTGLYRSHCLQLSLVNRLQQEAGLSGSMEYYLTWRPLVMRSGRLVYRQLALTPRITGPGFFGWPTCTATDAIKRGKVSPRKNMMGLSETVRTIKAITLGQNLELFFATMGNYGELNPEFCRWLMGFPGEWSFCGLMAMQ